MGGNDEIPFPLKLFLEAREGREKAKGMCVCVSVRTETRKAPATRAAKKAGVEMLWRMVAGWMDSALCGCVCVCVCLCNRLSV